MKRIYQHATLLVLTCIIVIHAIDRLAIVIMLQEIKTDLQLSDAQLGFLSGFAFLAVYVLAGVPMAFISDRWNRCRMIGIGLTFVGGMTAVCAFAQNFVQLVAARCGVGIAASPCIPASHSIIADIYPPSQRTTALSITESGFFVGAFVGLWLCGWIATAFGWRTALFAVGVLPAVLGLVVLATMRDPVRALRAKESKLGFWDSLGAILGVSAVRWYVVGSALAVFASAGMMTWLPTLMIRSYGMSMAKAGALIGAINGVGGLIVTILVGVAADRLAHRNRRWNLWLPAILFAVAAPFAASTFLSHTPAIMLVCFAASTSVVAACTAPIISYTQQILPSTVHAMITAVTFLVFNVVGFGFAPLAVGALSDSLTPSLGSGALQQSLLYVSAPALILAATFVTVGAWRRTDGTAVQPAALADQSNRLA